ncbi:MAG: alanine racemase [Ichthyobacteriaceae bacterium]|nr:alanine racemase [Ichthyobacteriaceae bacterium]
MSFNINGTSKIELNYNNIKHNVSFIKELAGDSTKVSAVIKGNAYGHGSALMLKGFEKAGINHFSVFSSTEARDVFYHKSSKSTLMILGYVSNNDINWVLNNQIEFFIATIYDLKKAIKHAKVLNVKANIHLDLETGMNRTGLNNFELEEVVSIIKENNNLLNIAGVTSHFGSADSLEYKNRLLCQLTSFTQKIDYLNKNNIYPKLKHIANSAGLINHPQSKLDMVRIGVLLYGYWPSLETLENYLSTHKTKINPIRKILNWNTVIMAIKYVDAGEYIGYGVDFKSDKKLKIMLLPIGYSNGYNRNLSNTGEVLVNGKFAKVVGKVNMNILVCDVSDIENIDINNQVTLIGYQGKNEVSFLSYINKSYFFIYEILSRLPESIERGVING